MARLSAQHLVKAYAAAHTAPPALRGVSLDIHAGESVAICGRSGSGKSTLLGLLGLLDQPDSGSYRIDGQEVARLRGAAASRLRGAKIGFVFQSFQLLPRLSVLENIALPALYLGRGRRAAEHRAAGLLEKFAISALRARRPDELSGGQRQLVALCRSLVNEPPVLLADEPTGNLDSRSAVQVADHLLQLAGEGGHTVVIVTHDPALAARCGRRLDIVDGRLSTDDA